jgi:hypothetical protein
MFASIKYVMKNGEICFRALEKVSGIFPHLGKHTDLNHIAASKLNVFLVSKSFPIDDLAFKQPPTDSTPLKPNKTLSSLFASDLSDDDVHIWVKAPPCML